MAGKRTAKHVFLHAGVIVLDLFSGIGGFSLGLHWAGFRTGDGGVADGLPAGVDRSARLRALGDAVSPEVAAMLGRAIRHAAA